MVQWSLLDVEIVEMLLENGADPYVEDKNGVDSLMLASTLGRAENMTFWLSQFQIGISIVVIP